MFLVWRLPGNKVWHLHGSKSTSAWQKIMTSAWQQIKTLSPLSQTLPSQKISHCGDTPAIIKGLKHLQQPTAVKHFYHSWKQSRKDDIYITLKLSELKLFLPFNQSRRDGIYLTLKLSLSSRREVLPLLQPTVTRQPLNKFDPSFFNFLICRKNIVFHLLFPFSTCSWTLTTFKGSSATWISYRSVLESIIKHKLDIGVDIWKEFLDK